MGNLSFRHGGNIYECERKYKRKVIDFSANINPLGLPRQVRQTIADNLAKTLHYPDVRAGITAKIADFWGVDEKNVLLGNGSAQLIYLIVSAFRPASALIPVPTFSEYERAARNAGSRIIFLKLREKEDFKLKTCGLDKADIFFLCNPNNPTGNLLLPQRSQLKQITGSGLLVADEAFMDFLPDQRDYTLVAQAVQSRKIIVLRTFTKFFALPGLRIGYLIAHHQVVDKLKQHQPPWSINVLAQSAAEAILGQRDYSERTYRVIARERRFLFEQLKRIPGLSPYPSVTNFLLVRLAGPDMSAEYLQAMLVKRGILIRDCGNFRNLDKRYFRIAVRSRQENLKLIKELRFVLRKHKRMKRY